MLTRRQLLARFLGGSVALAAADIWLPGEKQIFLPPRGGWVYNRSSWPIVIGQCVSYWQRSDGGWCTYEWTPKTGGTIELMETLARARADSELELAKMAINPLGVRLAR